jgi:hypothetical protein
MFNCFKAESTSPGTGLSIQPVINQDRQPGNREQGFSFSIAKLKVAPLPLFTLAVVFLSLVLPARTGAKVEGYPRQSRALSFFGAVSPVYRFPANVDGGGTLSVTSVYFNAGVMKQITPEWKLGLSFTYEFDDYNFSGLQDSRVSRPWKEVQRLGFSIPIFYSFKEKWQLVIVPTAQFSGEFGARVNQAMVYGGAAGISYTFGPKVTLGVGVAGYADLEEARVFPFPIVKLKLSDRIRLTNPFRVSPAGPAGLELSYGLTKKWEVGLGAAFRSYRFRLDYDGPLPNGIGEYNTIPVFARLSYKPLPVVSIDLYAGASLLNKIYVEDSEGNELYRTKHDVAPLLGATLSGRF